MKKALNFRPAFYFALVFACGIVCVMLFFRRQFVVAFLFLAAAVLAATFLLWCRKRKTAGRVLLFVIAFILGSAAMLAQAGVLINRRMEGQTGVLTGTITDDISSSNGNFQFLLRNATFKTDMQTQKLDGTVRVSVWSGTVLSAGDEVVIECTLRDVVLLKKDAKMSFYRTRTFWTVSDASVVAVLKSGGQNVDEAARVYIRQIISQLIESPHDGTAIALVIGDMSFVVSDVNEAFKATGITHVFSVSGLHVSFVILMLNFALRKLKVKKVPAFVITVLIVAAYAWLCNFSSSVVRSAVMASVLLLARVTGRPSDLLSSLGFSAVAILFFRPLYLFDYSFLMSFAAVFGIACAGGLVRLCSKIRFKTVRGVASAFSVSLGATAGTLPMVVVIQGGFSFVGLFFNATVLPLVTVVFIGLQFMLIPVFFSLAIPLQALLEFVTNVTLRLAGIPFAVISMPALGAGTTFFFALMFVVGGFVFLSRKTLFFMLCSLAVLVVAATALSTISPPRRNEVFFLDGGGFVVHDKNGTTLAFVDVHSSEASVKLLQHCREFGISEIEIHLLFCDQTKRLFFTFPQGDNVKVSSVCLTGSFPLEFVASLRNEFDVHQLDYGTHRRGITFRTAGFAGKAVGMEAFVGQKRIVFVLDGARHEEVFKNFATADVLIMQSFNKELSAYFPRAKKVSLNLVYQKGVRSPALSGSFTLRVKNDTMTEVY